MPMTNKNKKLIQGNIALCEGAIRGRCQAYFGYPITPQNEVTSHMARRMRETGRVFLQAESELAAINMVLGAAVTGTRVMTSSSSPGISLKQEGISYLCANELPCVIGNVMRGGPGLGNISGSQSDYFQATKGGGHGDYRMLTLAPASVQEMYDFATEAFNLAEKYRNPVMLLADGYLGQIMEALDYDTAYTLETYDKSWILDGCKGREPRSIYSLIMGEGELEEHNLHLQQKYSLIKQQEVKYELVNTENADIILVAFGIAARVCKGVLEMAGNAGIRLGLIRPVSLWPFPSDVIASCARNCGIFLVVEMNHGQMVEDVRLAINGRAETEFYGRAGGVIIKREDVFEKVKELLKR